MTLVAALVLLGACSQDDGRTLRTPDPGATAPPRTTETTQGLGTVPATVAAFRLTSSAFAEGRPIPVRYSCDGANVSPPLAWGGIPGGTQELALVVVDPDAHGFVHWAVWGIDPATTGIPEGQVGEGTKQAVNQHGTRGWYGPCPPSGEHRYVFTLNALSKPLDLEDGVDGPAAQAAINTASAAQAVLTGTFER